MKFYAVENMYGSNVSHGFANTWQILVFKSKKGRDEYVNNSANLSCLSVKKVDLPIYTPGVKPFTGDYLGIETRCNDQDCHKDLIGVVAVFSKWDYQDFERLY